LFPKPIRVSIVEGICDKEKQTSISINLLTTTEYYDLYGQLRNGLWNQLSNGINIWLLERGKETMSKIESSFICITAPYQKAQRLTLFINTTALKYATKLGEAASLHLQDLEIQIQDLFNKY
jgi:hypothetical protein